MARATLPWRAEGFPSLCRVLKTAREPWRGSARLRDPSQGLSRKVKRCQPRKLSEEGTGWRGPVPRLRQVEEAEGETKATSPSPRPPVLCPRPLHGRPFFGSSSQVSLKTHRVLHVAGNKCCWRGGVWAGVERERERQTERSGGLSRGWEGSNGVCTSSCSWEACGRGGG